MMVEVAAMEICSISATGVARHPVNELEGLLAGQGSLVWVDMRWPTCSRATSASRPRTARPRLPP